MNALSRVEVDASILPADADLLCLYDQFVEHHLAACAAKRKSAERRSSKRARDSIAVSMIGVRASTKDGIGALATVAMTYKDGPDQHRIFDRVGSVAFLLAVTSGVLPMAEVARIAGDEAMQKLSPHLRGGAAGINRTIHDVDDDPAEEARIEPAMEKHGDLVAAMRAGAI